MNDIKAIQVVDGAFWMSTRFSGSIVDVDKSESYSCYRQVLGIPYLAVIDRRDPSKLNYGSSSTSFTLTRGRVYVVRISKSHFQKVNDIPQSRLYIF